MGHSLRDNLARIPTWHARASWLGDEIQESHGVSHHRTSINIMIVADMI